MVNLLLPNQNRSLAKYSRRPYGTNGTIDGNTRGPTGLTVCYDENDPDTSWKLALNTLSANIANRETQDIMEIGADNRHHLYSFVGNKYTSECVAKVKKMTSELEWTGWKDRIEDVYQIVKEMKCGNCGEYAAVAFTLLKKRKTPRPLDFVGVGSKTVKDGYTHNFVVIGLRFCPVRQAENPISLPEPKYWGPVAVVCDAYNNKVYPAEKLDSERSSDRFRHSLYRFE